MTAQIATYDLPPVMKSEDCRKLDTFLREHRDRSVMLNCASVTRIGGQGAQVIAAHLKFRAGGTASLLFDAPSEACLSSFSDMGLAHLIAQVGVTA